MKNNAPAWIAAGLFVAWLLTKKKAPAQNSIVVGDWRPDWNAPKFYPPVEIGGQIYSSNDGVNYYPVQTFD